MNKIDLAEEILKTLVEFRVGTIAYHKRDKDLQIWSTAESDSFFATDLITVFNKPFECYLSYDSIMKKVILRIY